MERRDHCIFFLQNEKDTPPDLCISTMDGENPRTRTSADPGSAVDREPEIYRNVWKARIISKYLDPKTRRPKATFKAPVPTRGAVPRSAAATKNKTPGARSKDNVRT